MPGFGQLRSGSRGPPHSTQTYLSSFRYSFMGIKASSSLALLCLHQVDQDVIDPGQMPWALGPQPSENLLIQPQADGDLLVAVAEAEHTRQLLLREMRDVTVVDA